tara:strand:+ start:3979 stop:6213 length:2235 start_codon:yes stop_codon:yes gene_type:complete
MAIGWDTATDIGTLPPPAPAGFTKTNTSPEIWWDGKGNWIMRSPSSGEWEYLENVPAPAPGYRGEAQSNYSWPPMEDFLTTQGANAFRELQRLSLIPDSFKDDKTWYGSLQSESILKKGFEDIGMPPVDYETFMGWDENTRREVLEDIAELNTKRSGFPFIEWDVSTDQAGINKQRSQMSLQIRSMPDEPTLYQQEYNKIVNRYIQDSKNPPLIYDETSGDYIPDPSGISPAQRMADDLYRLTGKGDPQNKVVTVPQLIAQLYQQGEDDAALELQEKWNAITPYEQELLYQRDEELEWNKLQGTTEAGIPIPRAEFSRQLRNDIFNQKITTRQMELAETTQANLQTQRGIENKLARDYYDLSDQQFQQTYGLSKNQFLAGENQRAFENRFAQDQFNAQQEQLQFNNQLALTDQAFRATELGLDLLNSPGDLFTFLTRLRGDQGSLPFQLGGQAIPRTFPFTFNQAIPPQPFGLRDMDWAPPDYDWGPGGYEIPEVPDWIPGSPPPFPGDGTTGDGTQPPPSLQPPTSPPPLQPVAPTASDDAVRQIMRDQAAADDPVTWDVAREIANIEAQTTPTAMATPASATVAPTSAMAPTFSAEAASPMGGTIAQAGMINPAAQTSPSQQFGFGGTGTRTVTPSGMPMTTLQPFGLPTSTVGPLPEQGLSQAFLGMPPTGRRTLASLGAPPALSYQSMSRLTPTERAIRLSEAKAQGFSEQDFLEEDIRHQMGPRTGGGRARFVPGRFRG